MKYFLGTGLVIVMLIGAFFIGRSNGKQQGHEQAEKTFLAKEAELSRLNDSLQLALKRGFEDMGCREISLDSCLTLEKNYLDTLLVTNLNNAFQLIDANIDRLKVDPLVETLIYWRNIRTRLEQSQMKWEIFYERNQEMGHTIGEDINRQNILMKKMAIEDLKNRILQIGELEDELLSF